LLPEVSLEGNDDDNEEDGDEFGWSRSSKALSFKYAARISQFAKALSGNMSQERPPWSDEMHYRTPRMRELLAELDVIKGEIAGLAERESTAVLDYNKACGLQTLLFGTGASLEEVVRESLSLMGFDAHRFAADGMEFDVVFTADGKRLLGEVEGRDSAAIDVDKVRQLVSNLLEDFGRPETEERALGVLFGNPERLREPRERTKSFTEKCTSIAVHENLALVLTHTMFEPTAYLQVHQDSAYAEACRRAIYEGTGRIVEFPPPPS
jgi:hypothetical protein